MTSEWHAGMCEKCLWILLQRLLVLERKTALSHALYTKSERARWKRRTQPSTLNNLPRI